MAGWSRHWKPYRTSLIGRRKTPGYTSSLLYRDFNGLVFIRLCISQHDFHLFSRTASCLCRAYASPSLGIWPPVSTLPYNRRDMFTQRTQLPGSDIHDRIYSLMPLKGVVEMNTYGCCTQGLVFPREQVDGLITFLKDIKTGQTDFIIEEYADMARFTQYALVPQQLQHVGLKSSRDNLEIYTGSTWAFWFEENDPAKLKREHEDFLQHPDIQRMLGHV